MTRYHFKPGTGLPPGSTGSLPVKRLDNILPTGSRRTHYMGWKPMTRYHFKPGTGLPPLSDLRVGHPRSQVEVPTGSRRTQSVQSLGMDSQLIIL